MARRGFDPQLRWRGSAVELIVGRCGVETAAMADPDVVCELHQGLIEGMLEATGGEFDLRSANRRDPRRAGCRFRMVPIDSVD
jgi:predicted ArsR family transcriptional regulator